MGGTWGEGVRPPLLGARTGLVAVAVLGVLLGATPVAAVDAVVGWRPVVGAAGYRLYIRQSGQIWPVGQNIGALQPDPDGVVRYLTSGLLSGVLYEFAISAYDPAGYGGSLSNVLSLLVSPSSVTPSTATSTPTRQPQSSTPTATGVPPPPLPTASFSPTDRATVSPTPTATVAATVTAPPGTATGPAMATASPTPSATPIPSFDPSGFSLSGQVRYYADGSPVADVSVDLQTLAVDRFATSDQAGQYRFTGVSAGTWELQPSKQGDAGDASSALDAAHVLQSVGGLRKLNSFEALGCDATGDGTVSALDATRILQHAVGLIDRLPAATACGSDWLFVPALAAPTSGQQQLPPHLTAGTCQPGTVVYDSLQADVSGQDFTAVAIGDCTGNWTAAAAKRARTGQGELTARLGTLQYLRGRRWALPIHVSGARALNAVEVAVDLGSAQLEDVHLVGAPRNALVAISTHGVEEAVVAVASPQPLTVGVRPVALLIVGGSDDAAPPQVHLTRVVVDERLAAVAD